MNRTSVIGAISKVFSEMYYINLKDNTIQKIESDDLMQKDQREENDAGSVLREFADTQVVGAFRPIMRNFVDVDTMGIRLGDKKILSQEYMNGKGEWKRTIR